jgi:hypothetical protein
MLALLLTLATMVALVLVRHGTRGLLRLTALRFRAPLLPLAACAAQLVAVASPQQRCLWLLLSAACLSVFCWRNRLIPGSYLVLGGLLLNMTVMELNNGYMPLNRPLAIQTRHQLLRSGAAMQWSKDMVLDDQQARLAWLGDRLTLPGPLERLAVWSIGDVVLLLGVGRLLFRIAGGCPALQASC